MRLNMKLIEVHGIKCYTNREIKNTLTKDKYRDFCEWHNGQTGIINDKGEFCVYEDDFASWDYYKNGEQVQ